MREPTTISPGGGFFGCRVSTAFFASLERRRFSSRWTGFVQTWRRATAPEPGNGREPVQFLRACDRSRRRSVKGREEERLVELMERYQFGDHGAFEVLHNALAPKLRRFLLQRGSPPNRVEDLLQESFLQIHRSREKYRPGEPLTPWVMGIANHVQLMERRSIRSRIPASSQRELPARRIAAPSRRADPLAEQLWLDGVLSSVEPDRANCFLLHHVWGYSFGEVGRILGITPTAAKNRSYRVSHELRDLLRR